ncbi:mechanosensitive ion channel family protein [Robiginitalea sp. SC105]|uniref:mechanosensitive ion channel family protein n=1 Tax=Robiginitalea sp. SC105 TaxID=2762332 RepID=UPI00163AA95C|nr:mechanosensitive ion channel domain-containing protein [Robiginitalea sp. SC105]MBC2839904.1 mechanosensitive ion channel [Robiginitalea sp. SC105]
MLQDKTAALAQDKAKPVKEFIERDLWDVIREILNYGLHIGEGEKSIDLTIGLLLSLSLAMIATTLVLKWLRNLYTRKMEHEDRMKFFSVFKYIRYAIYMVVVLLTVSSAGIDITLLITASAALFVGIGLALQEFFQDIIAGIMILVDKSLHVGDIVEVDGKVGKVFEIKLRSTRALTRDDKVLVIPNHKFMSEVIYNYTQNHRMTRESVQVGVAYGSDVELVTRLLLDAVNTQKGILKNPKPFVQFEDFGDSALIFSVKFFINDSFSDPRIKSDIRYRIDRLFRENSVTIPFPQRDVHFYAHTPLAVRQPGNEKQPGTPG